MKILVTGAAGFIGRQVVSALAGQAEVVATDVRELPLIEGVHNAMMDIRSGDLVALMEGVDAVVHLAAIVTPPPGASRQMLYDVDVGGTQAVLDACLQSGVKRFVYTSSGAAYGYHPDSPPLLDETEPVRGNEAFAYACHKRMVEELLAKARAEHPSLQQLVFRVSTILGPTVDNQITAMFERPVVVGIRGSDSPFCFVSDADVVACLVQGALGGGAGVYNLTGDGVMTLREIAVAMGRRYVGVPEGVLVAALRQLHARGLSPYGPEQTMFLKHRPVMATTRLKRHFGYTPALTSRQVFETYRQSRAG